MNSWLKRADLTVTQERTLPPPKSNGGAGLTVSLWLAKRPRQEQVGGDARNRMEGNQA
jgi:hypothetical protein